MALRALLPRPPPAAAAPAAARDEAPTRGAGGASRPERVKPGLSVTGGDRW